MQMPTLATVLILTAAFAVVGGAVAWALLAIGLQEANDPAESRPEDLTEFEKRHTHRPDVQV